MIGCLFGVDDWYLQYNHEKGLGMIEAEHSLTGHAVALATGQHYKAPAAQCPQSPGGGYCMVNIPSSEFFVRDFSAC